MQDPPTIRRVEALDPRLSTWAGSPLLYLRQVITGFLQGVYESVVEQEYRWSADPSACRLYISSSVPVDGQAMGKRPCIAVSRSALQSTATGIGGIESIDNRTGSITRRDLLNMMFVAQHISTKEDEAEDLAAYTYDQVWANQEVLGHYGMLLTGNPAIEQPGPVGSLVSGDTKGMVAVPVVLPIRVQRCVRSFRLGDPILNQVQIRIRALTDLMIPSQPSGASLAPANGDPANIGRDVHVIPPTPASRDTSPVVTLLQTEDPKKE